MHFTGSLSKGKNTGKLHPGYQWQVQVKQASSLTEARIVQLAGRAIIKVLVKGTVMVGISFV